MITCSLETQLQINMHNSVDDNAILLLEETLFILEECLQGDNSLFLDAAIVSGHIQILKSYYSPDFDFDYAETGSYFYAALNAISKLYIGPDAVYCLPLTTKFKESLEHLLNVSRLSINHSAHKQTIINHLLALARLWKLYRAMDMRVLILQTLSLVRRELPELNMHRVENARD